MGVPPVQVQPTGGMMMHQPQGTVAYRTKLQHRLSYSSLNALPADVVQRAPHAAALPVLLASCGTVTLTTVFSIATVTPLGDIDRVQARQAGVVALRRDVHTGLLVLRLLCTVC